MQNAIDRTNSFYIEMSEKVLPEKEYGLLHKLMTEKSPLQQAVTQYGVTSEYVEIHYESTLSKVKAVTELLSEINEYIEKLQELKQELNPVVPRSEKKKLKTTGKKESATASLR